MELKKMILKDIQEIISKNFDIDADSITEEFSFEDTEIDDLDILDILFQIEDTFHIIFEETEEIQTVGNIVRLIQGKIDSGELILVRKS